MSLAVSRLRPLAGIAIIAAAAALPLSAAAKHRAVGPVPEAVVSGVVLDATTNQPVKGVEVLNGVVRAITDATGHYTISLPQNRPTLLTANYFAYKLQTKSVTPVAGATLDFSLDSNPSITVKTTAGETVILDYDTSKFAYAITFIGYVKDDNANFCTTVGQTWAPNKSEFNKLIGPGTLVNFSPCCTLGPIMTAHVEMKSGEKSQVYFNDSCFGNEVDFLGRERSTGNFRYFAIKDIAEIDFP
jgi:hypothetical protein